jgi:copper chaperone
MTKTVLNVEGMSCEHCVNAVTKAVGALPGIAGVAVDLDAGTVTVEYEPATVSMDKIRYEIVEQGFEVVA